MKNKITLRSIISFAILFLSLNFQSLASVFRNTSSPFSDTDNNLLKLNLATSYGVKVVQVSFDGNDGDKGFFQVKNKDGVVIRQIDEVELIKSPSYFSVDVSDYASGDYTFTIKTANNTYSSTITIK